MLPIFLRYSRYAILSSVLKWLAQSSNTKMYVKSKLKGILNASQNIVKVKAKSNAKLRINNIKQF